MKLSFNNPGFFLSISASIFFLSIDLSPAGALEQEVFFGTYIETLHNENTRGATLAYRLWLTRQKEDERGFSLLYPRPITLGLEFRGGRVLVPETGWEGGISLLFKYERDFCETMGGYLFLSGGGSYSGVNYPGIPTNFNFLSRGGVGFRLENLILQGAYEHRSNGGLRKPNQGLDLIQVSLGFRF